MLDRLPADILGIIISHLSHQFDFKHLSETSKFLHEFVISKLYESITIYVAEDDFEDVFRVATAMPRKYMKYIKSISFKAPLHKRITYRCPAAGNPGVTSTQENESPLNGQSTNDSTNTLRDVRRGSLNKHLFWYSLSALKVISDSIDDDKLRNFSWELGTCLPWLHEGIDCWKMLTQHQSSIETLSFITDPHCSTNVWFESHPDLEFSNLRALSWKGLAFSIHIEKLGRILESCGESLRSLTLGLNARMEHNEFAFQALKVRSRLKSRNEHRLLPNLEELTIYGAPLADAGLGSEIAHTLNLTGLKVLKIHCCDGVEVWLRALLQQQDMPRLETFELVANESWTSHHINLVRQTLLMSLIRSSGALKNFFMNLVECDDSDGVWLTVSSRRETLQRIALQSNIYNNPDLPVFAAEENPDNSLKSYLLRVFTNRMALSFPRLRCLGIEGSARYWRHQWAKMDSKPPWTLIHFRADGLCMDSAADYETKLNIRKAQASPWKDWAAWSASCQRRFLGHIAATAWAQDYQYRAYSNVMEFASWAFSADGFPELKVVAHGDFAFEGRYSHYNLLLCRDQSAPDTGSATSSAVRPIGTAASDEYLLEFVNDNMDMLASAPARHIFSSRET